VCFSRVLPQQRSKPGTDQRRHDPARTYANPHVPRAADERLLQLRTRDRVPGAARVLTYASSPGPGATLLLGSHGARVPAAAPAKIRVKFWELQFVLLH